MVAPRVEGTSPPERLGGGVAAAYMSGTHWAKTRAPSYMEHGTVLNVSPN